MQKRRCPEEISQKNGESEKDDGLWKERMRGKTGEKGRGRQWKTRRDRLKHLKIRAAFSVENSVENVNNSK